MDTPKYVVARLEGCKQHMDITGVHVALEELTHAMHINHESCPTAAETSYAKLYNGFELLDGGYIYILIDEPLQFVAVHIYYPPHFSVLPRELLQLLTTYFACDDSSLHTIGAIEAA